MGIKVDRISGSTRFETSLEIAKKISNVSEIAVVNGEKGLSDATSIAAVAANKNMPIVLMPNKGTNIYDQFIKDNNIQKTYIIGQTGVISTEIESKLPNSERIGGLDRNETNAKIIEKFYTSSKLDNMFVCKNGSVKQDQLIDALSVGVLAAKENSPVVIVGNSLSEYQKNVLKNKEVKKMTQIGGGCEKAFEDIKGLYKK
nr:cell wall-binding repeat-containing protein [Clostridium sp. CCUG 7971]